MELFEDPISFIKMLNSKGQILKPWGKPDNNINGLENEFKYLAMNSRSAK